MAIVLGLDGGGSHLRALARTTAGDVLFRGQSGAANLSSTPEPRLRSNFQTALADCPEPDAVAGCFAGLLGDDRHRFALRLLRDRFPRAQVRAEPDWAAALTAHAEADVCVIAGTGSLVCSRGPEGWQKSGGRGYLLGDEGSGFQFGRDALRAWLDDPTQVSERVTEAIQDIFGTLIPDEVVPMVYRLNPPAGVIARLSKPLFQDAKAGFPYALATIERHARDLAPIVARHVKTHRADAPMVRVFLAGGTWKASSSWVEQFRLMLERELPDKQFELSKMERPPVEGACRLAEELLHGN